MPLLWRAALACLQSFPSKRKEFNHGTRSSNRKFSVEGHRFFMFFKQAALFWMERDLKRARNSARARVGERSIYQVWEYIT
jgi:hypothetical protein